MSKADELVAWRLLRAALSPELPAQPYKETPKLSKRLLLTLFPRYSNVNDNKKTSTGRAIPVLVYGRTKEK